MVGPEPFSIEFILETKHVSGLNIIEISQKLRPVGGTQDNKTDRWAD